MFDSESFHGMREVVKVDRVPKQKGVAFVGD